LKIVRDPARSSDRTAEPISLALREQGEPCWKEHLQSNHARELSTDAPIGGQLLSHRQVVCGRILNVPDVTPAGARNEGSGIGNAAAEDNDVLPRHGAGRDNTPIGSEGRSS